jgi:CHAT domain-containing protein
MTRQLPESGSKRNSLFLLILLLVLSSPAIPLARAAGGKAARSMRPEPDLEKIRAAFERGEFESGVAALEQAIETSWGRNDVVKRAPVLLLLSEGYEALGRPADTVKVLNEARRSIKPGDDPSLSIQVSDRLAAAHLQAGRMDLAGALLDQSLALAQGSGRGDLRAMVLNDLGTLQAETGNLEYAIRSFGESVRLAREMGLRQLEVTAGINQVTALVQAGRNEDLERRLAESLRLARETKPVRAKALHLLSIGSQFWSAQWRFGLAASWRKLAYDAYCDGLDVARVIGDRRLISYGLGFIGRLYEDERRYDEALRYTRQATFLAQEAGAADIRYLWEWQAGRILRARGEEEQAIVGYRQSLRTLQEIRSDLNSSRTPFQRFVGPVFRELADLLLRRSSAAKDQQAAQRDLLEVRATLEELKRAEVAEYFRDDCVVQTQGAATLDTISAKAAVIYPVLLADRTELLVSLPGGLKRFSVNVGLDELTSVIRDFRRGIDVVDESNSFEPHARRLYDWLIRPLAEDLRRDEVSTLVIVPDGPLRTIPLAALHDGNKFLVENYAVVTTPGLTLTSARPAPRAGLKVLAGGLTEAVQGFSPLPNVARELASIEATYPAMILQDSSFKTASIVRDVSTGAYSILHFATHGHFDREPGNSFLLTFDGKITMDGLQDSLGQRRFREDPVELLVLSACQTAAGDDRAALGLAGVGLKAGARSVLASLWSISDESTAILVSEFHKQLTDKSKTKAEALRIAQRLLLEQQRFRHPYYWAPFILIGNWL